MKATNSDKKVVDTQRPKSSQKLKQSSSQIATQDQLKKIPISDRLSIITKSKLDGIKEHMPRPRGSVPVIALPSWKKMSLDNKIPRLPGNDFFFSFTRGQIGDSLLRPGRNFDTSDLRNTLNTYSALHDPHAKSYFNKPSVKCLLRKQGLITYCDEVLCSQKDFNAFRSSLAKQYNQKLKGILQHQDKQVKSDRDQLKRIKVYENMRVPQENDILYECLALLLTEPNEILEDYIDVPKLEKLKAKKSEVVDWRKQFKYDDGAHNDT